MSHSATTIASLASDFAGELIEPDQPAFDEARKVFNGMHDKRPGLIARCTSSRDVQLALEYAQHDGMQIAVRGGGHSTPGYSTCDGGLVIDLGPMKKAEIDPERRTGRFGPGLRWSELDAATQAHGLAVTGGRISHTGIAGLTLGSGSGWLERKFGMTAASLLSAELVCADGRVLRASAEENAELFWGLKGGAGNFGIVTEFEFRLHSVGPLLFAGMILHPRAVAPELIRFYRDFIERAPDEVGGGLALITAPPEEFVPEPARGQPACGVIVAYVGDPDDGPSAFGPLLEWGDPLLTMVQPMPYIAVQQMIDGGFPWGINDYSKSDYLPHLPDAAIDQLVAEASGTTSPFSQVILCPLGGAVARMDQSAMALTIPDAKWMYFCEALSWDRAEQDREIAWARAFMESMRRWSVGKAPPNFLEPDEGHRRLRVSFGEEKFGRLVALKAEYDPHNTFSLNANIPPTAG
ncbi:MAG: FAD-binding oxidoreductase [Solirubrobacterales bacterium]|nr:FAD-binding oxidoreductase [Solirubrobacterales bacterium]